MPPAPTPEQVAAQRLRALNIFFVHYDGDPRPAVIPQALHLVKELTLLRIPEARYGIAGAIHGLVLRHPELAPEWKESYANILAEAASLMPDIDDREITRVGEIDYLFMMWLVGGDPVAIDRIVSLAQRTDTIGQAALAVIVANSQHPGVVEALNERAPLDDRMPTLKTPEAEACRVAAIRLAERLGQDEQGALHVLYVGYAPTVVKTAQGKEWDHRLVVCTPTGKPFPGLPNRWEGIAVDVRQATADEMLQGQHIRNQLKDTI